MITIEENSDSHAVVAAFNYEVQFRIAYRACELGVFDALYGVLTRSLAFDSLTRLAHFGLDDRPRWKA